MQYSTVQVSVGIRPMPHLQSMLENDQETWFISLVLAVRKHFDSTSFLFILAKCRLLTLKAAIRCMARPRDVSKASSRGETGTCLLSVNHASNGAHTMPEASSSLTHVGALAPPKAARRVYLFNRLQGLHPPTMSSHARPDSVITQLVTMIWSHQKYSTL